MNLFIKQKQIHRLRKQTYGYHEGTMGARDSQGVLDRYVHTAIFKMNNQQGPSVQPIELCSILYNNLTVTRGEGWGKD